MQSLTRHTGKIKDRMSPVNTGGKKEMGDELNKAIDPIST